MAKQAVESFKNSNNLFDMAEFLQRGFECDGGKGSNSGPRGTREPAGPRREYKVPIEDRPGVWAVGVEAGASVYGASIYYSPQFVFNVQDDAETYATLSIQATLAKESLNKIIEALGQSKKRVEAGGGVTMNFVNAKDIDVYTEGTVQGESFSTKNFTLSATRYLYENEYYYGYSVGIGYYTPGIDIGTGYSFRSLVEMIKEKL